MTENLISIKIYKYRYTITEKWITYHSISQYGSAFAWGTRILKARREALHVNELARLLHRLIIGKRHYSNLKHYVACKVIFFGSGLFAYEIRTVGIEPRLRSAQLDSLVIIDTVHSKLVSLLSHCSWVLSIIGSFRKYWSIFCGNLYLGV